MERRTYSELLAEVKNELGLNESTIINDATFVQYANDAIQEAETRINEMREDYFLTWKYLFNGTSNGLIAGQEKYPLPDNIFSNKIRQIVYSNGDEIFPLKRFRHGDKLHIIDEVNYDNTDTRPEYSYLILNAEEFDDQNPYITNFQLQLIPTPQETGNFVKIWYLRETKKIPYTDNTDTPIDIPECYGFVKAAFKLACAMHEHHVRLPMIEKEYSRQLSLMEKALKIRVEDGDNLIQQDLSTYQEFVGRFT